MKRFAIAAALAAVFSLGAAGTADAQYVIQYNRVTPNGGVATTRQLYNLGAYQSYNTYYSPWGTMRQQYNYADVFGNSYGRAQGFSPYYGAYNRGFYQPNPYFNPYGGYNYNFYRRW
jgi:hypothetical protein